MKKFLLNTLYMAFVLIAITSCTLNSNSKNILRNLSKVLEYKNSCAGDNSAVSGILNNLPGNKYLNGIELKTSSKPYGIIANYKNTNKQIQLNFGDGSTKVTNLENILKDNSTIMFALIENLDYVEYKFDDGKILKYTREKVLGSYKEIYGENLQEIIENQRSLEKFLK